MNEKKIIGITFFIISSIIASVNLSHFMIYGEYSILTFFNSLISGVLLSAILIEVIINNMK